MIRNSTQTRKKMDVRYNHEDSSMRHAAASLTKTLPKKGIREAPEEYHHTLYALSAMKQGRTKMDNNLKDLCTMHVSN